MAKTVKIKHPEDPNASFSIEGVPYTPDSDGIFEVPEEKAAEVLAHGFVIHDEIEVKKIGFVIHDEIEVKKIAKAGNLKKGE